MLKKLIASSRMLFAFGPFLAHGISATRMRKTHFIILLFLLPALLFGLTFCSGHSRYGERLESIDDVISQNPDSAISLLKTIPADSLADGERKFYELLTVKANDKAYVIHESDSLINEVIDYYSRHKGDRRYAEALYYGGRVNSDMGDYPTALRFFEDALDQLPESAENLQLRATVLSQTARLLESIGLFEDAETYLLEAVHLDSITGNVYNLAYDHQLLGATRIRMRNFQLAVKSLMSAKDWAVQLSDADAAVMDAYIASIHARLGKNESALNKIRELPEKVNPGFKNLTLAWAAQIYRDNNIADTAVMYAKELITSPNKDNRKTGYSLLLSPEFRQYIAKDSLNMMFNRYKSLLEESFLERGYDEAVVQQTMYNYYRQEKEQRKVKQDFNRLSVWFYLMAGVLVLSIVFIIRLKYQNYKRNKELMLANDRLSSIINQDKKLDEIHADINKLSENQTEMADKLIDTNNTYKISGEKAKFFDVLGIHNKNKIKEISETKMDSILKSYRSGNLNNIVPEEFKLSDVYKRIKSHIDNETSISDNNILWEDLENLIEKFSPSFKKSILILMKGKISDIELHTLLLTKCNFSTSHISILCCRAQNTISTRKKRLCLKMFDKYLDVSEFDRVIRLL